MPHIANRLKWKSFAVAKLNPNSLENIDSSLVCPKPTAQAMYFTGKVLQLPIDP